MELTSPVRLYVARRVLTMTPSDERAIDAFAVHGDRVLDTGTAAELADRYPRAERVELGERVVVPGFNDAHQHLAIMTENLLDLDVSRETVSSLAELTQRIRDRAAEVGPGAWIRAIAYDPTELGAELTRDDLDEAAPANPVMVLQVSGHWGVLSSPALAAAGYHEAAPPPEGGDFGRDADGRLNGVVYEQAVQDLAYPAMSKRPDRVVPPPARQDLLAALRRAQDRLHAAGITSVCDALVGPEWLDLYSDALARGLLSARVGMLVAAEHWPHLAALGLRSGFGSERLRIVGVKVVSDGAISGRTCWVDEPFEGSDDHGMSTIADDELRAIVRAVHEAGSVVAVHANGDRAIRRVLAAIDDAARATGGTRGIRHRIEHCTIVDDTILDDLARLGVVTTPFATYVAYHGRKLLDWYGAERLERMFPHRSFLERGIAVAGASDFPAGPFAPLLALQSCVTRRSLADGTVLGGSQRISPYEALRLYTVGSAYAEGLEHVKGALAPGMLADFVALEADPTEVDPDALAGIGVSGTWVGGEQVWAADAAEVPVELGRPA